MFYYIFKDEIDKLKITTATYLSKRLSKNYTSHKIKAVYNEVKESRCDAEILKTAMEVNDPSIKDESWIDVSGKEFDLECLNYIQLEYKFMNQSSIGYYMNPDGILRLRKMALMNNSGDLDNKLEDIWFQLPDNRFNIIENPPGWSEFLSIIEK